jgi:hypothetical protein
MPAITVNVLELWSLEVAFLGELMLLAACFFVLVI